MVRAEILQTRNQGGLESRAGPFLRYVQKYKFFGEIYTSDIDRCQGWAGRSIFQRGGAKTKIRGAGQKSENYYGDICSVL